MPLLFSLPHTLYIALVLLQRLHTHTCFPALFLTCKPDPDFFFSVCEVCESSTEFWVILGDKSLEEAGFATEQERITEKGRLLRTKLTVILKSSADISEKKLALNTLIAAMPASITGKIQEEMQCILTVVVAEDCSSSSIKIAVAKLWQKDSLEVADVISAWPSGEDLLKHATEVQAAKAREGGGIIWDVFRILLFGFQGGSASLFEFSSVP